MPIYTDSPADNNVFQINIAGTWENIDLSFVVNGYCCL